MQWTLLSLFMTVQCTYSFFLTITNLFLVSFLHAYIKVHGAGYMIQYSDCRFFTLEDNWPESFRNCKTTVFSAFTYFEPFLS